MIFLLGLLCFQKTEWIAPRHLLGLGWHCQQRLGDCFQTLFRERPFLLLASCKRENGPRNDSFIHIITFINSNSKNRNAKNDNYTKAYIYIFDIILFDYMYVIYGTEFDHAGFNDPT